MEKGNTCQRRNIEPRLGQIVFATPRFKGTSPSIKTPYSSQHGFSEVPFNDDEAERRQRRRENHLRSVMSPGCHTPKNAAHYPERPGDSGTSSFTNAEITDHYAVCIKLSAENKINSKNAFGLHLIDWMSEVLRKRGEMTNFQVAGCTLDASAKIYAGRVDSIYNDAFKMLGGFGRSETRDEGGGDGEDTGEDGERAQQGRQGGRKKGKKNTGPNVQTIEKDPKSLNANTFDMEFEVDPLFKKISSAIDEEGTEGMLLNQIGIDNDGCGLMLDASKVPSVTESERVSSSSQLGNVADAMKEIRALLQNVRDLKICPTFSGFKFNEGNQDSWNMKDLLSSSSADNEYCPRPDTEYSMVQQPSQRLSELDVPSSNPSLNEEDGDSNYQDDDDLEPPPTPGSDDVPAASQTLPVSSNSTSSVLGTCGDGRILTQVDPTRPNQNLDMVDKLGHPVLNSGELCLMENIEISEYSYFKPQVLSAWAGPQHWKLRPRNRETDPTSSNEINNKEQLRKKKQTRQVFRVDFTKPVNQELFKKGRCSTVLSQAAVEKLSPTHNTLPPDPHTNVSVLYQLFTRPRWKIKRRKLLADAIEEPLEGEIYKYDNPTDNARFTSYVDDAEGGGVADDDNYDDTVSGLDDVKMSGREFMSMLVESQDIHNLVGDNLVSEPQKVNPIQIDYAKHAKRMDIKKIKSAMWSSISSANDGGNKAVSSPSSTTSSLSFTSLYSDVLKNISSSMAKEMSVSISFVCLLHLANEKSLSIVDREDMSDLFVSLTEASPRDR